MASERAPHTTQADGPLALREKDGARQAKRDRIIAAAIQVFAEKGFFSSRVSEIARVAGVADGTIYLYFNNKEDLLIQVFEESMERVISRLDSALCGVECPAVRVRAFIELHLAMVEENPELAEVLTVELRQSAKFMKQYKNPKFGAYLRMIGEIVEQGVHAGVFRSDLEPTLVARALFGMLDELALAWVLGKRFGVSEAAQQVYEMFMDGMRSDRAASQR